METQATTTGERQYLTFLMGSEQFSLDILQVKEIIAFTDVMKIPLLPEYVKGVINLRGHVVPVIDLALRFGNTGTSISKLTCIIIIEIEKGDKKAELGIMVDAVNEVISLSEENIEDRPEFGEDVRADFISGMGKIGEKFIIMLNVSKILHTKDIDYLHQAAKEGSEMLVSN
ncbi:MAG: chemotaxis protein CheW [Leptospirales bacterium]